MIRNSGGLLLVACVSLGAMTMSGTVYDQSNTPKAGVVVSLKNEAVSDTTNTEGAWTFSFTTGISAVSRAPATATLIVASNKSVRLYLPRAGIVRIDAVDCRGVKTGEGFMGRLDAGMHRIPLGGFPRATTVTYLNVQVPDGKAVIPTIGAMTFRFSCGFSGKYARETAAGYHVSTSASIAADTLLYSWQGTRLIADKIPLTADLSGIIRFVTIPPYKGIPWNDTVHYGVLKDDRDNTIYRTITVGTQTWMAQNLNYGTQVIGAEDLNGSNGEKYCYKDAAARCDTFGGLYQWSSAMALDVSYNSKSASDVLRTVHRGICPTGWHMPTSNEWSTLKKSADTFAGNDSMSGQTLKSTGGWATDMGWGPGTDDFGFRAIAGGGRYYEGYNTSGSGSESYFRWCCRFRGMFWTVSQSSDTTAYYEDISDDKTSLTRMSAPKSYGFCVRCIRD